MLSLRLINLVHPVLAITATKAIVIIVSLKQLVKLSERIM